MIISKDYGVRIECGNEVWIVVTGNDPLREPLPAHDQLRDAAAQATRKRESRDRRRETTPR